MNQVNDNIDTTVRTIHKKKSIIHYIIDDTSNTFCDVTRNDISGSANLGNSEITHYEPRTMESSHHLEYGTQDGNVVPSAVQSSSNRLIERNVSMGSNAESLLTEDRIANNSCNETGAGTMNTIDLKAFIESSTTSCKIVAQIVEQEAAIVNERVLSLLAKSQPRRCSSGTRQHRPTSNDNVNSYDDNVPNNQIGCCRKITDPVSSPTSNSRHENVDRKRQSDEIVNESNIENDDDDDDDNVDLSSSYDNDREGDIIWVQAKRMKRMASLLLHLENTQRMLFHEMTEALKGRD